ncbi:MAG: PAS domain-containing protein [Massilimicrobiota timonensis]
MEITFDNLAGILDAYAYEVVFVDRHHIVRYMNKVAKERYAGRVQVGQSLFCCHNENSRQKIEAFLQRADQGEDEMFETLNQKTGEREFFVPVRVKGQVIGYFERHEAHWDHEHPEVSVVQYWKNRI